MKRKRNNSTVFAVLLCVLLFCAAAGAAQEDYFCKNDETVFRLTAGRINGTYRFTFFERDLDQYQFLADQRADNNFTVDINGEAIYFRFQDGICEFGNGTESIALSKQSGRDNKIEGRYSLVMEDEGEIELLVEEENDSYRLIFGFWELQWEDSGIHSGMSEYSVEDDWGEKYVLRLEKEEWLLTNEYGETLVFQEGPVPPAWLVSDPPEAEPEIAQNGAAGVVLLRPEVKELLSAAGLERKTFSEIFGLPMPPSADTDAEQLKAAVYREIVFRSGRTHSISPDGSYLLFSDAASIGLYSIEEDKVLQTHSFLGGLSAPASVSWSPLSDRVLFTENFFVFFKEPDIHEIIVGGAMRNRTDDGTTQLRFGAAAPEGTHIDLTPLYLKDGRSILFQRLSQSPQYRVRLAVQERKESRVDFISPVFASLPSIVTLDWDFADGIAYYTHMSGRKNETKDGIWRFTPGGEHEQVISSLKNNIPLLVLKDVSYRGDKLLAYLPDRYIEPEQSRSPFVLIDTETGYLEELFHHQGRSRYRILNAAFSPEGTHIAYVFAKPDGSGTVLAVYDLLSGGSSVLHVFDDPRAGRAEDGPMLTNHGLQWSLNDTLFVIRGDRKGGYILKIETP